MDLKPGDIIGADGFSGVYKIISFDEIASNMTGKRYWRCKEIHSEIVEIIEEKCISIIKKGENR